jgi:Ni,Fe-hydrogenase III large subunit
MAVVLRIDAAFFAFGRADLVTFVQQILSSPVLQQRSEIAVAPTKPASKFALTGPVGRSPQVRTMAAREAAETQSLASRRPFRGRRA